MYIVYVGGALHSAWDKQDSANLEEERLCRQGKTNVSVRKSKEFDGMLENGHHFD